MSQFPWGPAPKDYIPGLSRGATGFIDTIEKGIIEIDTKYPTPIQSAEVARKVEEENRKADEFYKDIDNRMKLENQKRRKHKKQNEPITPKTRMREISNEFADLVKPLASVSAEQWANLPEIGDTTYHRPVWDTFTFVSDRMAANDFSNSALTQEASALDREKSKEESPLYQKTTLIDITPFFKETDALTEATISHYTNLERASSAFRKMTSANPTNADNWLVRIRLLERQGFLEKARKVSRLAMTHCSDCERVVMEAARLATTKDAVDLLRQQVSTPLHEKSDKLWVQLISYTADPQVQKVTLENALACCPESELVWHTAALVDPANKIPILHEAVKKCQNSHMLWIEGIRSSLTVEDAQFFTSGAREKLGESAELFIEWAKAEERISGGINVRQICEEAVKIVPDNDWLTVAQNCELEQYPKVAIALIEILPVDNFLEVAKKAESRRLVICTREMYRRIKEWESLLAFESVEGDVTKVISEETEKHPDDEKLAIVSSRYVSDPIDFLESAIKRMPMSGQIALGLVNAYLMKKSIGEAFERAKLLVSEIKFAPLYVRYVELSDRMGGDRLICEEGVKLFPNEERIWLSLVDNSDDRLGVLKRSKITCPQSTLIYLRRVNEAESMGLPKAKVRPIFEEARRKCSRDYKIWLANMMFEDDPSLKMGLIEEAKKNVSNVGPIFAAEIEMAPLESRYSLAETALHDFGPNLKEVELELALYYWRSMKIDSATKIIDRIMETYPGWADGWVYSIIFKGAFASPDEYQATVKKAIGSKLVEGYRWENMRSNVMNIEKSDDQILHELVEDTNDPMTSDDSIFQLQ